MADKKTNSGSEATKGPLLAIERIYVKDMSFETPLGTDSFMSKWEPVVELDLNNRATKVEDDLYEVVLRITATARKKDTDSSYYLIEVQQAGIFRVANLGEEERKRLLATAAPATLFPYVRETIDSLLLKGGFPPLMLAPVNFEALLQAALKQQMEKGGEAKVTIQ